MYGPGRKQYGLVHINKKVAVVMCIINEIDDGAMYSFYEGRMVHFVYYYGLLLDATCAKVYI